MYPVVRGLDSRRGKTFPSKKLASQEDESASFIWPQDPHDEKSEIRTLTWKVVLFGLTCSPFILRAVLDKHFKSYEELFPETVHQLLDQIYADDVIGGAGLPDEAIER